MPNCPKAISLGGTAILRERREQLLKLVFELQSINTENLLH